MSSRHVAPPSFNNATWMPPLLVFRCMCLDADAFKRSLLLTTYISTACLTFAAGPDSVQSAGFCAALA